MPITADQLEARKNIPYIRCQNYQAKPFPQLTKNVFYSYFRSQNFKTWRGPYLVLYDACQRPPNPSHDTVPFVTYRECYCLSPRQHAGRIPGPEGPGEGAQGDHRLEYIPPPLLCHSHLPTRLLTHSHHQAGVQATHLYIQFANGSAQGGLNDL